MTLRNCVPALLVVGLIAAPGPIFAGERSDDDHRGAVLELGAAGEWGLQDGKPSFGPSVAIEVTPIEHWLEIEAGITPLRSKDGTEWEADVVFKKPFQLSKNVEFMVGAGPQWSSTNSLGAVAVQLCLQPRARPKSGRECWASDSPAAAFSLTPPRRPLPAH